ncbi:hypothetical protein FOMPIDRAFT_101875 [Fomitopsis schrenkii]|uniref:Uncharacterized protein n=1 Tax=Fomitopsis schrenkii TaxID=2126942 RepID=S8DQA8_FOMSC|nr:hypothetical protein FOMPIDRAFT_101875 [Fomitopsis schrenkii]
MPRTGAAKVLQAVNKKSGGKLPAELLRIKATAVGRRRDPSTLVVSLYCNYNLNRRDLPVKGEVIKTLWDALGLEGHLKWFVDSITWSWERWRCCDDSRMCTRRCAMKLRYLPLTLLSYPSSRVSLLPIAQDVSWSLVHVYNTIVEYV